MPATSLNQEDFIGEMTGTTTDRICNNTTWASCIIILLIFVLHKETLFSKYNILTRLFSLPLISSHVSLYGNELASYSAINPFLTSKFF